MRRVGPDGIIDTAVGTGTAGYNGDGLRARIAQLNTPSGLAVGADGSLYVADAGNHRVRRIAPTGTITTVAGTGGSGFDGDGGPATAAAVGLPIAVAVGREGSLYVTTGNRLRRVAPDGIITTVAGQAISGFAGDGGPPLQASVSGPAGVAVGPDAGVYLADTSNQRIRRIEPVLPWVVSNDIVVAAEGGREAYVFDPAGRHVQTINPLTGAARYTFGYDAGRLVTVTDGDALVTTIERDLTGNPTGILAPFGQRTTVTLDAGYLWRVTSGGATTTLTHSSTGLLTGRQDPNGHLYTYGYDATGRLQLDADPAGGSQGLARTRTPNRSEVTLTTGEGRSRRYAVERLSTGQQRRSNTSAANTTTTRVTSPDASRSTTRPDGTALALAQSPDPRFGMTGALPQLRRVTTPGGRQFAVTQSRDVTMATASPWSLVALTDTLTVNGRPYQSTFDAATATVTERSPEGRQTIRTIDGQERVLQTQVGTLVPVVRSYEQGCLATITQGSGPQARTTTFTYDADGRLATVTAPLNRLSRFAYNAAGRVATQTLPDGREIGYDYDANGNVTAVTPPGRPAHGFLYTPVDLPQAYVPPALPPALPDPRTVYTYKHRPPAAPHRPARWGRRRLRLRRGRSAERPELPGRHHHRHLRCRRRARECGDLRGNAYLHQRRAAPRG